MFINDALLMAGPDTKTINTLPGDEVGNTAVLAVHDKGNWFGQPAPDDAAATVGPPNRTIQQIVSIIGPPPPQAYLPITAGNLKLHWTQAWIRPAVGPCLLATLPPLEPDERGRGPRPFPVSCCTYQEVVGPRAGC